MAQGEAKIVSQMYSVAQHTEPSTHPLNGAVVSDASEGLEAGTRARTSSRTHLSVLRGSCGSNDRRLCYGGDSHWRQRGRSDRSGCWCDGSSSHNVFIGPGNHLVLSAGGGLDLRSGGRGRVGLDFAGFFFQNGVAGARNEEPESKDENHATTDSNNNPLDEGRGVFQGIGRWKLLKLDLEVSKHGCRHAAEDEGTCEGENPRQGANSIVCFAVLTGGAANFGGAVPAPVIDDDSKKAQHECCGDQGNGHCKGPVKAKQSKLPDKKHISSADGKAGEPSGPLPDPTFVEDGSQQTTECESTTANTEQDPEDDESLLGIYSLSPQVSGRVCQGARAEASQQPGGLVCCQHFGFGSVWLGVCYCSVLSSPIGARCCRRAECNANAITNGTAQADAGDGPQWRGAAWFVCAVWASERADDGQGCLSCQPPSLADMLAVTRGVPPLSRVMK